MIEDHGSVRAERSAPDSFSTSTYPPAPPRKFKPSPPPAVGGQQPTSLVRALEDLAERIPDRIAYTFLNDGDLDETNITYLELHRRARSIAARLQQLIQPGDRAALVYEPSLEYIAALVGCFYAGVIAVPVYPPDPMRIQRTVTRLQSILDDCQAELILTGPEEHRRFSSLLTEGQVIETTSIPLSLADLFVEQVVTPETLAFLQYTSGSTGKPKGVMLTHSNLMFNFEHIRKFDESDAVAVSWLPMYHDMGLIGLVLQALQSGRRTVLMSPLSFVKRPFHWLKAISRYRAYATSGPSFAYELCVQKISDEELAQLDLSCWTLACNGAEPIRVDTMRRFAERFAPAGFRWETFYPCYGLAEATLIVSGGKKADPPVIRNFEASALDQNQVVSVSDGAENARALVGCGESVVRQKIRIVDPQSHQICDENQVGEIWVAGPGVAQGYWNRADESAETFRAYSADGAEGPFLRTGDLGFLQGKELFVTGRIKDLIIIRGRNHYPQDIERTVESCHKSLRRDHGAAFAVNQGGNEKLVVVQGVVRPRKLDLDKLFSDIRSSLLHEHELAPAAIVLVKCGEIPRTSSGKIQRRGCRELYESGQLEIIAQWNSAEAHSEKDEAPGKSLHRNGSKSQHSSSQPPKVNGHPLKKESSAEDRSDESNEADPVLADVSNIIRDLKDGRVPEHIGRETHLFADLNLESIDLVMLNEMIEQHYQTKFPFQDFMAELGRQNQRDISLGQFADFISDELNNKRKPR